MGRDAPGRARQGSIGAARVTVGGRVQVGREKVARDKEGPAQLRPHYNGSPCPACEMSLAPPCSR